MGLRCWPIFTRFCYARERPTTPEHYMQKDVEMMDEKPSDQRGPRASAYGRRGTSARAPPNGVKPPPHIRLHLIKEEEARPDDDVKSSPELHNPR